VVCSNLCSTVWALIKRSNPCPNLQPMLQNPHRESTTVEAIDGGRQHVWLTHDSAREARLIQ
ncbi:hypothetical protein AC1031_002773, partial [Aphanomyces cochlioides]